MQNYIQTISKWVTVSTAFLANPIIIVNSLKQCVAMMYRLARGSMVRTLVLPDLWLTGCGKLSDMAQPTRPTEPSIPQGSVNE